VAALARVWVAVYVALMRAITFFSFQMKKGYIHCSHPFRETKTASYKIMEICENNLQALFVNAKTNLRALLNCERKKNRGCSIIPEFSLRAHNQD
jgi:hypothetical protein